MADAEIELISMREAGIDCEIVEDGTSFSENALKKARAVCAASGEITMADDSGLSIDALDGAPGIYSARFMGEETPYSVKNAALIEKLEGLPDDERTARFTCAVACVFPDGRELLCEKHFEGIIGYEARGENGFGYDPIFYLPDFHCTSAELSPEEKNAISHRGKALRAMRQALLEAGIH